MGGWLRGGQFGVSSELLVSYDQLWLFHFVAETYAEGGEPMFNDG